MTTDLHDIEIDDAAGSGYDIVSYRSGSWIVRNEDGPQDDLFEGRTFGEALAWVEEHPKADAAATVHDLLRGLRLLRTLVPDAETAVNDPGASVLAKSLGRGVIGALAIIDGKDR